jgi:outer membrane lipoprotein carrier protein
MKFAIALFALAAATGVQAQSPEAVMERAVKGYSDMRTMRADFTQVITNPLTGTNATSRGVLMRKDPNFLAIRFTDPSGDRIVSDGVSLWVYLPSSAPGQVLKLRASSPGSMGAIDPGGIFLTSPASRFTITGGEKSSIGGRNTISVNLVPKKTNSAFSRARVWVDASDYSIRQFEIVDVNGLTRLITLSNVRPDAAISGGEFSFTPPRGVRVIEG